MIVNFCYIYFIVFLITNFKKRSTFCYMNKWLELRSIYSFKGPVSTGRAPLRPQPHPVIFIPICKLPGPCTRSAHTSVFTTLVVQHNQLQKDKRFKQKITYRRKPECVHLEVRNSKYDSHLTAENISWCHYNCCRNPVKSK